jgi:hypothetical protein
MTKLTAEQVAAETGIGAERIRQMCRTKEIEGVKIAGVWFFSRSVVRYINNRKERRGRRPKHLPSVQRA